MSAKYLYENRYNLSEEQQNEILSKADSTFKAQPNIDKMISHLEVLKNVAVGKKFTDFEMADPKGEVHQLSEFVGNGKVVLIDFWVYCPKRYRRFRILYSYIVYIIRPDAAFLWTVNPKPGQKA